ncbi:TPA: hypothetical protein JG832_002462 [Enterobacter hormaechei subsp. xiangfangensis]|nr:hypothetical protein [Enterobacter hormaechei subsp. xiangfangensis]HAV1890597.1 hypothetical protein [Enterobacter hormaechei subsp. xiangfangensis]
MKKMTYNLGNQNAAKPEGKRASLQIQQRVTPARKERWIAQAEKEGLPLTNWMQIHLDAVCDAADQAKKK